MREDPQHSLDSKDLGLWGDERFVVGYVDEVNGPGAVEVPNFAPTRHELIQLAKYWASVVIDVDFYWFLYQQTGSSETRRRSFAGRRLARIADALGEEEVGKAVREAENEFAKGIDPRTWNIFLKGTPQERQALQDEIQREMYGVESAETAERIESFLRSLGVDCLVPQQGKPVRIALLPARAFTVEQPPCTILPVVHYLNADPSDGRYRKNPDGWSPPVESAIRYVGLSPLDMKHIKTLTDEGRAACEFDIVMERPDPAWGHAFFRVSNKARWRANPTLAEEVEKAAAEASNGLAAKVAARPGITAAQDFDAVLRGSGDR